MSARSNHERGRTVPVGLGGRTDGDDRDERLRQQLLSDLHTHGARLALLLSGGSLGLALGSFSWEARSRGELKPTSPLYNALI